MEKVGESQRKMKPSLVFGIVFTYLISLTVVGNAAKRRPRLEKRQILQNRATVKIQLPSPAKKSVVESAKKDATTKKEVKQKSEHYVGIEYFINNFPILTHYLQTGRFRSPNTGHIVTDYVEANFNKVNKVLTKQEKRYVYYRLI